MIGIIEIEQYFDFLFFVAFATETQKRDKLHEVYATLLVFIEFFEEKCSPETLNEKGMTQIHRS